MLFRLASKVVIAIVYSGSGSFSEENRASLEDFTSEVDDTRELVTYTTLNQGPLHSYLQLGAHGASISDTVNLFFWGVMDEPIRAYYGQISASDLAGLHEKYGHKLFSSNIKMFLGGESTVNRGIIATAMQHTDHFLNFNNGVTALANSITHRAIGGATRNSGQFEM